MFVCRLLCLHFLLIFTVPAVTAFSGPADDSSAGESNVSRDTATRESLIRERIFQEGIPGTLIICGGGSIPEDAKQAFADSMDKDRGVLILPVATSDPAAAVASATQWLKKLGVQQIVSPKTATMDADTIAQTSDKIRLAGAVWICGGQQTRIAEAYVGTDVEAALRELLDRGGVIGGNSAGAAIMTKAMIASGKDKPEMATGFNFLPDAIIDQHFTERDRSDRLRYAISKNPQRFGLGIDEATAVIVSGRNIDVVGNGSVTVVLGEVVGAEVDGRLPGVREEVVQKMPAGSRSDLTQLRRAARWRASGIDPGQPLGDVRQVTSGSLVIVGGGGMPKEIIDRFVKLAGGVDARIVVLPTASSREEAFRQQVPRFLTAAGVKSVTMLPQSRTEEVASEAFRLAIEQATGVWFDGGRQWNFVDAYENTDAVRMFHDVLRRGGVIGGSSAGATIQGEYLVRGHPLGNSVMMAEGYERGFSFLPGVAIDQHFSQRNRFPDLIPVVERYRQILGIGIDEATAIVVSNSRADVIGRGAAHFLDSDLIEAAEANQTADSVDDESPKRRYRSIDAGKAIDLKTLQVIDE